MKGGIDMPDITMCNGIKCRSVCPLKDTCYRHRAIPSEFRQAYFMTAPFKINEYLSVSCDYYAPVRVGDKITKVEDNG